MAISDRILPLCDLLLGAAYADNQLASQEREEVRAVIKDMAGSELPSEVDARIFTFDPNKFDLNQAAAHVESH